jgi:hypothetical protein
MSAPAFTPGPWYVTPPQDLGSRGQQVHIMGGKGATRWGVAIVGTAEAKDADTQSANARLIAAAPELYEALAEMVGLYGLCSEIEECAACSKAQAALAKARGEQ